MPIINEKDYYQVCCDVINLLEKNYTAQEKKEASAFAIKETNRLDKIMAKRDKKVRVPKKRTF